MTENTNIRSIATMASLPVYDELVLLLRSIKVFHPNIPIFISAQSTVKKRLEQETGLPANITITLGLEKYGNKNWRVLSVPEAIEFLSQKSIIIEQALKHHPNSLFMDSDVTIASPLGLIDDSKDLGLTPAVPELITKFGKYNTGWVFVNNKEFPHWWKNAMAKGSSPFIEQLCLNNAAKYFDLFHFPPNYNFSPNKQLSHSGNKPRVQLHRFLRINSDTDKGITYEDKPLISFHHRFNGINSPWDHFIMMHLYKGSPELFKLINSSTNYSLSDRSLAKNETYVIFAIPLNKYVIRAIGKNILFLYLYTRSTKTNIRRYYYKLVQRIVLIILYPYYLINEGIYFYHAANRLTNRKLSRQTLIKILGQAFYHFSKGKLQRLFSYFGARTPR